MGEEGMNFLNGVDSESKEALLELFEELSKKDIKEELNKPEMERNYFNLCISGHIVLENKIRKKIKRMKEREIPLKAKELSSLILQFIDLLEDI